MKLKLLILAAILLIAASGCDMLKNVLTPQNETAEASAPPSAQPETEEEPEVPPPPSYSGELNLSMRMPKTLNPLLNSDKTVADALLLVFEPLFNIGNDFRLIPNLAESYELAADGLSAVIKLRPGALWNDGTSVTSEDFIFTVEALKNAPDGAVYKYCVQNIRRCAPLGDYEVKVEFAGYYSGMEYMFVFPLIPMNYYEGETEPDSGKNMTPLGSGSYEFVSYKFMEELKLKASRGGSGAYIQNINIIITPDAETDLSAFNQGMTDVLSINYTKWSKSRSSKEARVNEYNTMMYDFIGFNFNNPFIKDRTLREVIARSLDTDKIITNAYINSALKTATVLNPQSWLYEKDAAVYNFDLSAAEELLLSGNFTKEQSGIFALNERGGSQQLKLRILVNKENDERVKIAESLKESLNYLGIVVQVESLDFDVYKERLAEKDFDLFVGGFNLFACPDLTFSFSSGAIEGGENFFSYSSPELDALLQNAYLAAGSIPLYSAMSDVQKYIADDLAVISVAFRKSACLTSLKIRGDIAPCFNNIFAGIGNWYIAE